MLELKYSSELIGKSNEILAEVKSWIDIGYDNLGFNQVYLNFPKYPSLDLSTQLKTEADFKNFVLPQLQPMFELEQTFLLQLVDCLKRTALGESLSDD